MTFQRHPLTDDLIALKNEQAIARSLKNIVFTTPGEKFFNETFGSRISNALFDNVDDISASLIIDEIRQSITNFEPRVDLLDVKAEPNFDNNEFNVRIVYNIVGVDVPIQNLQFVLQQTR